MTNANHAVLAESLWPAAGREKPRLRAAAFAVCGAAALAVSAKIQIPFYPVPLTLQTMFVLLFGMAFGAKLGAATVLLYLVAGAAGLPVFAGTPEKGIGLAYMAGPTGGYLAGFALAAAACGALAQKGWDKNIMRVALAMLIGNGIIYACGMLWLGAVIGWDKPLLQLGMLPFLPGDAVKIIFASLALPPVCRAVIKNKMPE
ncbi:MAG: biotin transporter BioY [Gammaproteobacteria bacterium]